ncbi:MAG: ATP-binding protein [Deltaproteobacteria bacterium]|nr:ATP-binding protein [Deltaproteobacteria bacterium]
MVKRSRWRVATEADVHLIVAESYKALEALGARPVQAAKFTTAVSELARNILKYADRGYIEFVELVEDNRVGMRAEVTDKGPGIADIELALADSYSSSGTLGLGLPGVRRLAHRFEIESEVGKGTRVLIEMWVR